MTGNGIRSGRNRWTVEQRTVLHILHSQFNISNDLRCKVWNGIFDQYLKSCGVQNGLLQNALTSQYSERLSKPRIWDAIIAEPSTDEQWRQRHELTRRVQAVVSTFQSQNPVPTPTRAQPTTTSSNVVVKKATKRPADRTLLEPATKRAKTHMSAESKPVIPEDPVVSPIQPTNAVGKPRLSLADRLARFTFPEKTRTRPRRVISDAENDDDFTPNEPTEVPVTPKRVDAAPSASVGGSSRVAVSVQIVSNNLANPHRLQPITPSPSKARKAVNADRETVEYTRRSGPILNLTPQQIALTKRPLAAVPEALAHPPTSGLLYRYWDENSHGSNSETGFTAGRYMPNNVAPRTPKCGELDYADIENHLNRNKVSSPFCSAANCFLWIMRLALKEAGRGAKDGRITLIDADALPRQGVYHVRPFHNQLKNQFCFLNGAWRYWGTHEFMVWHQVPQSAIIHTFTIADLLATCQRLPALAAALRIETISRKNASLKTTILSRLQDHQISLDQDTVPVVARLCRLIGLTAASPLKQLEHLIGDVIQGWKLNVEALSSSEWASYATRWSHALCGRSTVPTLERELQLRLTFLHGVKAGIGEFNMLHNPTLIAKMQRKAIRLGLESPTKIILESVANATKAVLVCEQDQEVRYHAAANATRLLPGIDEYFQLESDVGHAGPSGSGSDDDEQLIMYDDDRLGL
ncbi:hypothetical protein LTR97_007558 [Elasticomyces elasticus]|uniref:DUF7587 domain-containing protein n=1 Tax=Elasticomyces elasticus TaxID=574655 RepID=A0AAN7W6L2_9PEZI|nr:hypothetical protein LTR97_007558 [Elasticomyces elasticus]